MIIEPQPIPEYVYYETSSQHYSADALADIDDACSDYPSRGLERALDHAAYLVDIHDDGSPAYYESLDPHVIGQWVFGASWSNPDRYDTRNVEAAREIFTQYCDVMRCASRYANDSYADTWHLLNDDDWFDPSWSSEWQFALDNLRFPGLRRAVQALIERSRRNSRLSKHDSARRAQHSRLTVDDWPELFEPLEPAEQSDNSDTFARVLHGQLPERMQDLIDEKSVLVVRCDSLSESELTALTDASSKRIFGVNTEGKPATCQVFARGLLRIPIISNINLLKQIRSRLVVAYVFNDYALLVEYPWCGMTSKAELASVEVLESQALRNPELVPATVAADLLPCRFMVHRVEGLPPGRVDDWSDVIPF